MTHRFSALSYANALPLVHFIRESSPEARILYYTPRHSVVSLLDGQADAALIPVIDFFAHPELAMVPGLGICTDGDVTSVLLRCHRPLPTVRTIGLDSESKSSNVLIQVLVKKRFRLAHQVEYIHRVTETDAGVCIGDRAMRVPPALETYDLAGEWKKMTGLPFVFAVWAVHRSCPRVKEIGQMLRKAKERGCQSRRRLAGLCSQRLGLPVDRCYDYLANRLHYDVGPRELEGLDLFRELAADFVKLETGQEIRMAPSHAKGKVLPVLERS